MKYAYKEATTNDYFVAGVSGFGYINPDQYPNTSLLDYAARTSQYMQKSGISYMELLDNSRVSPSQSEMDAFTSQSQIKGIFYEAGDRYVAPKGAIWWSNGKPVVGIRETLWTVDTTNSNTMFYDPYQMAYRISTYDKTPNSINGYTAVNVHAWSHTYADVLKMVEWWKKYDPNVVVVTPNQFMQLVSKNVPHKDAKPNKNWNNTYTYPTNKFPTPTPYDYLDWAGINSKATTTKTKFDFTNGVQGWTGIAGPKQYDRDNYSSLYDGSLFCDGSDLGQSATPDNTANSFWYNKIKVPSTAKTLSISLYSGQKITEGGMFRVLAIDSKGKITILTTSSQVSGANQNGWKGIKGQDGQKPLSISLNISGFAGKTTTFVLEQNDTTAGSGEYIYYKSFKIN
jgi:hypothetical protein